MNMNSFDDDGLFGGIVSDVPTAPADRMPLGGVHRVVMEALGTPNGAGRMSYKSREKVLMGVRTTRGDKGWKSIREQPVSLEKILLAELEDAVMIVSRLVDGSWRTGASDLNREVIIEFLEGRGYEMFKDRVIDNKAIEKTPGDEVICRVEEFRLTPR